MADINETTDTIIANLSDVGNNTENGTAKIPATPEGMAIAYGSLVLMAVLPIFFGAFRGVRHHQEQKQAEEKPDTMSQKDAMMFPLMASVALLVLYIFFKLFSKDYINLLLSCYFFLLGILAVAHLLSPVLAKIIPQHRFPNVKYNLQMTQEEDTGRKEEILNYDFDRYDLTCLGFSSVIGAWYIYQKHWIANNIFGLAFAINGVELLQLNNVSTGCILLGGLFIYDIFWVFGTDVMVTVAKSFDAPIKLVFPQDILENGLFAKNFAMLGLGDIVIPGIFIALLLRFDQSLKRKRNTYFNSGFLAYISGLFLTIFVMHYFKHAQPALLYLVPMCVGIPLIVAAVNGDIPAMFSYKDHVEDTSKPEGEQDQQATGNDEGKKEK